MKKTIIISFIAGAVIMATAYLGFVFFKSVRQINTNTQNIQKVVDFINAVQKQSSQVQQ